jgi:general secretion pathway protein D
MMRLAYWFAWSFLGVLLGLAVLCVLPVNAYAADAPTSSVDLSGVTVGQAVSLYYKEMSAGPYVVCSDVLADVRLVSIRAAGKTLDGAAWAALLASYGYEAVDKHGVSVVCKIQPKAQPVPVPDEPFLYRVKYRDSGYLADLLAPLVHGAFANRRQGPALAVGGGPAAGQANAPAGSSQLVPASVSQAGGSGIGASFNSSTGDDYLVFSGTPGEAKKLRSLLEQVDTPIGEVLVKAYMYEVGTSKADASALQLVMSALGGKVQASSAGDVLGNLLRLRTASLDVVVSALATDSRFKVVTAPYVRLQSGKTARFVSGGQQSILGAITTTATGSTQQSYDRVESGTILQVTPIVRGSVVDVDLFQQISSFVAATGSSAGQPPTLNKRELKTALSMQDGEVVVLAGLNDSKDDGGTTGLPWLPFHLGKSSASSSSEIVLVLEMKRL